MKILLIFLCSFLLMPTVHAENQSAFELYKKMETLTFVPWYYLAAINQYEENIRAKQQKGAIAIDIEPEIWAGVANPKPNDRNPKTIGLFGGIGLDGNGDNIADREQDEDILYTIIHTLKLQNSDEKHFKITLWNYYHRVKAVELIMEYAKIYQHFGTIEIKGNAFPLPSYSNYSYRNSWGAARSFGGRRIHEGTDIFANYGVPVRATCYGIVETKGWNQYGGWRVGIRDLSNTYHYYAHLGGFAENLHVGKIVQPKDIIGFVGNSGYGPVGTAGKFPPHLHFGMYKDNGSTEWSFDCYPYLKLWEQQEQ